MPVHQRDQAEELIRQQLGLDFSQVIRRREATATYNGHGMTFASRRTGIHDTAAVQLILSDDGYRRIHEQNVLPGDIVLYFEAIPEGLIHSGIVVAVERIGSAIIPKVLSKWGRAGEYIHQPRHCPYSHARHIRFYREAQHGS